jgi:hypothetical protein
MDLLESLPNIIPGSQDDQAREIHHLLSTARNKGKLYTWYQPPEGILIDPKVKEKLESKGLRVYEQLMYDLTWVGGTPVRGTMRRKYYIGALGRH